MNRPNFNLMRSLIYVNCAREQYRVKLNHWLYYHHIPESVSQFGPYVTKYAFYNALPSPPEGKRFGTHTFQLTEHYWLVNPMDVGMKNKTYAEFFPPEVLVWQGNLPESALDQGLLDGDTARASGHVTEESNPFIWAFVPICWELDLKGKERSVIMGPNYRWQFVVQYPEGVDAAEGDKWLIEQVLPHFVGLPQVRRVLSSKIIREVNNFPFHRVVELWFEGPDEWSKCCVEQGGDIPKPSWAQTDTFPYLKSFTNISGLFLADNVTSDNYSMYSGFQTLR